MNDFTQINDYQQATETRPRTLCRPAARKSICHSVWESEMMNVLCLMLAHVWAPVICH